MPQYSTLHGDGRTSASSPEEVERGEDGTESSAQQVSISGARKWLPPLFMPQEKEYLEPEDEASIFHACTWGWIGDAIDGTVVVVPTTEICISLGFGAILVASPKVTLVNKQQMNEQTRKQNCHSMEPC